MHEEPLRHNWEGKNPIATQRHMQVQNLREIKALQRLSPHNHIIQLIEVLYDEPTGRLALVFEIMEMNLYEAIKGRPNYLPEQRVKNYIY